MRSAMQVNTERERERVKSLDWGGARDCWLHDRRGPPSKGGVKEQTWR
ncbi:unnamed protein product, partial [Ectocarpus sp. 13 AM-2016]